MSFHKSNLFIVIALILVGLIVVYVIVQDKQPSEEFTSLTDTSTSSEESDSKKAASQTTRRTSTIAANQEGSFGLKITQPSSEEQLTRGTKFIIRWEGTFTDRVKIFLRRQNTALNMPIDDNIFASVQKYEWTVPISLNLADDYYFMIIPQIQSYSKPATSATFSFVDLQAVSPFTSIVEAIPFSVSAEPNCFTTVTVKALNQYGLPLSGKKVDLISSRQDVQILTVSDITSSDGSAIFKVGSQIQRTIILNAIVDGVNINDTESVSFITPPPFCNTR